MGKYDVNVQILIIYLRGCSYLRHFISVSFNAVLIVDIVFKFRGELISVKIRNSGMVSKGFRHLGVKVLLLLIVLRGSKFSQY